MKSHDPSGRNLFSRLSQYTFRENHSPFENFCTEALAFFFLRSDDFLREFLKGTLGISETAPFEISTQHLSGGKFIDLALISSDPKLRIAIEVKFDAPFQPNQLENYADEFESVILLAPRVRLHSTKAKREIFKVKAKGKLVGEMSWEEVACLLTDTVRTDADLFQELAQPFSEFLKSKGIRRFNICMSPSAITSLAASQILMDGWSDFLSAGLAHLIGPTSPQWRAPRWVAAQDPLFGAKGSLYIVQGKGFRYAGFEILGDHVKCYYEEDFRGQLIGNDNEIEVSPWPEGKIFSLKIRTPYPEGDGDRSTELQWIFSELQKNLVQKAKSLGLERGVSLDTDTDEEL